MLIQVNLIIDKNEQQMQKLQNLNLAMVSDFCYPFLGGVQLHIMKLCQHILPYVNKLIIITHQYPQHIGIHQINKIKIYYLKLPYAKDLNITWVTFCYDFFVIKNILQEEQINLIHTHQSSSCLVQEVMTYAQVFGIKVVHTEHSIFACKSFFEMHMDKFLQIAETFFTKVICVSRTTRNNFYFRSNIHPNKLIVIPNAAQIKQLPINFKSLQQSEQKNNKIYIISVGRLTHRRGVDLLISFLPQFLIKYPQVVIKIIGDGTKRSLLQTFVRKNNLSSQILLLGSMPNQQVLSTMRKCQIYINTPLTQSFGIALIQAALEGLFCVSTQVGGIVQTLPQTMLISVEPTKNQFIIGLSKAVEHIKQQRLRKIQKNNKNIQININSKNDVKNINDNDKINQIPKLQEIQLVRKYNWKNVSERVFEVYKDVLTNHQIKNKWQIGQQIIKKKRILGVIMYLWLLMLFFINSIHTKLFKARKY